MLPEAYLSNIQALFKEEYEDYLNCFTKERYYGLRVNTDKISLDAFKEICPFELQPIPWTDNGFYISAEAEASKHPLYNAGAYYLQEPSAMLPAASLPIEEGDLVFDCCAAPGGKSDELLNKMDSSAVLFSNDISASRSKALLRNLEKHGSSRFFVISEDITRMDDRFLGVFDKILIDAPCSGEGMFRKDHDLIKSWNEHSNDEYAALQKKIVERAVAFLKPGGLMVYSTCTFSKKENEETVRFILDNHSDMEVVPLTLHEGFVSGDIPGTLRLYPHRIKGEGHFTALLKKRGESNKRVRKNSVSIDIEFFKHIKKKYYNCHLETYGDGLYLVPQLPFDTKGVRVLRSGLLIGTDKKGRFEPSQALALSLKREEFDQVLDLGYDEALKYLRGDTLECDLKGYVLVCYEGLPLGFGKANGGVLNNKIDKGWRRL